MALQQASVRKILFLAQDASRSGAPMVLLNFMRWLRYGRHNIDTALLLTAGGELVEEFTKIAPVQILDRRAVSSGLSLPFKPDVYYFNSVGGAMLATLLPAGTAASVCHVHELEYSIQAATFQAKPPAFTRFNRVIACAEAVRQSLVTHRSVPAERIDVVHEFILYGDLAARAKEAAQSHTLREQLHLSADALIVGCIGSFEWRKGADVFLQMALAVRRKAPDLPAYFVWIGSAQSPPDALRFNHDLSRLNGLKGRLFCLPPQSDPLPYFTGFDLFVSPSREDPFPLVCLEAAACGKAIVCFAQAGGMPEFVQSDAGLVVAYLDVEAMADAVIRLLQDPKSRETMGQNGNRRVREHYDVNVAAPMLLQSVERAIASTRVT